MAEQLSTSEKIHYTNWWCNSIGIKSRDLDNHPQIDDVILLIKFHQATWSHLSKEECGYWAAMWSLVYHKQYPLKGKHFRRLEAMANNSIQQQNRLEVKRQQIKALRANREELKKGTYMTANCSFDADSLIRV